MVKTADLRSTIYQSDVLRRLVVWVGVPMPALFPYIYQMDRFYNYSEPHIVTWWQFRKYFKYYSNENHNTTFYYNIIKLKIIF